MTNGNKTYEKNISKAIVKALNQLQITKVWKRRAGPFEKGRADITGSCFGTRIEIEVKVPGNDPTPKQQAWIDDMKSNLCIAGCAHSVEEALAIVRNYFESYERPGKYTVSRQINTLLREAA
jgi:hypothetical protein